MNARQMKALGGAYFDRDGWGLFFPKTTAALADKGYFEKKQHPRLGMQWQITDAGRAAYREAAKLSDGE